MILPYPDWVVVPLDIATAGEMNELMDNITALTNGKFDIPTGDGSKVVKDNGSTSKVTADNIDWATFPNPKVYYKEIPNIATWTTVYNYTVKPGDRFMIAQARCGGTASSVSCNLQKDGTDLENCIPYAITPSTPYALAQVSCSLADYSPGDIISVRVSSSVTTTLRVVAYVL
ncbi:MAG: hypothetical protein LBL84_01745 [Candidatus Nomurabacteria bacterium]|jgi:hypothetical protein|nr:hypothetical protein [Candidatus Nomurabacteria bacterium]